MLHRLSRRHQVAILTCILALTPIGVALARYSGVSFFLPAKQVAHKDPSSERNAGAIVGAGLPQYRERSGFDIRLPATTGPLVAAPSEIVVAPAFNSLAALDSVGATSGSKNWGESWTPESRNSSKQRPRRGSPSFVAGNNGNNGVGAWGGASAVAVPRRDTTNRPQAQPEKVVAAATPVPAKPPAASAPPKRGSSGGGGGVNGGHETPPAKQPPPPPNGDQGAGAPEDPGVAAPPATATPGATTTPGAAVTPAATVAQTPAVTGTGTVAPAALGGGSVSPASTPEPLSLMLVGTGLLGLYRARRYFE